MGKNSIRSYLKYAIGEILLVVIGIIIALQLNNWNENRKAHNTSREYLKEIIADLKADTTALDFQITLLEGELAIDAWGLLKEEFSPRDVDSIQLSYGGFYANLVLNDRTFLKMQNSGNAGFTGFDDLSDDIAHYYKDTKARLQSYIDWDVREVTERQEYIRDLQDRIEISQYEHAILGKGLLNKAFPVKQNPNEVVALTLEFANSIRYRNHLKNNYTRHLRLKRVCEVIRSEATDLIISIQQKLDSE
jgi:hypothetical protein